MCVHTCMLGLGGKRERAQNTPGDNATWLGSLVCFSSSALCWETLTFRQGVCCASERDLCVQRRGILSLTQMDSVPLPRTCALHPPKPFQSAPLHLEEFGLVPDRRAGQSLALLLLRGPVPCVASLQEMAACRGLRPGTQSPALGRLGVQPERPASFLPTLSNADSCSHFQMHPCPGFGGDWGPWSLAFKSLYVPLDFQTYRCGQPNSTSLESGRNRVPSLPQRFWKSLGCLPVSSRHLNTLEHLAPGGMWCSAWSSGRWATWGGTGAVGGFSCGRAELRCTGLPVGHFFT